MVTSLEGRLLTRDAISQPIDAYFVHVHHLPRHNFFYLPSMLESSHNDRIPPIPGAAIRGAAAICRRHPEKLCSYQSDGQGEIDTSIVSTLKNINTLNLRIDVLYIFNTLPTGNSDAYGLRLVWHSGSFLA